jgi:hypothetical protein
MIANSKNKSKNTRNATPTTYSSLIQSSINLEEDNVVLGDNNNIERPKSKKIIKKQAKKTKLAQVHMLNQSWRITKNIK